MFERVANSWASWTGVDTRATDVIATSEDARKGSPYSSTGEPRNGGGDKHTGGAVQAIAAGVSARQLHLGACRRGSVGQREKTEDFLLPSARTPAPTRSGAVAKAATHAKAMPRSAMSDLMVGASARGPRQESERLVVALDAVKTRERNAGNERD
jgi:hypothetical protein